MKFLGNGSGLLGEVLLQTIRQAVREEIDGAFKQISLSQRCTGNPSDEKLPAYFTVNEAAAFSRLAISTIRLYIRKGQLRAYKKGSRVIVKRIDIEAFLEGHPIQEIE